MSAGGIVLKSEKQLKQINKVNAAYVLIVTASWCTHCCEYEPQIGKLYDDLLNQGVNLVRVDAQKSDFIAKWLEDVESLPALYIVVGGKFIKGAMESKAEDLIDYVN